MRRLSPDGRKKEYGGTRTYSRRDIGGCVMMFELCIQELQEKAKVYQETGVVAVLDAEVANVKVIAP